MEEEKQEYGELTVEEMAGFYLWAFSSETKIEM